MAVQNNVRPRHFMVMILVCAALMFGLSYLWHGIILNDYVNIRIPMWLYFTLSSLVYLVFSIVLNLLYRYTLIREMSFRGFLMGCSLGFFIYMIAFVLGVSFSQSSASHIAVDFVWQMIEQGIGGASLGFMYRVSHDLERARTLNGQ